MSHLISLNVLQARVHRNQATLKMMGSSSLVVGAFALLSAVSAWQPDYILRVSNSTTYSDCQPRQSAVVNGPSTPP